MTVLDKIKAFFKRPKPKAPEKKAVEPVETKAAEAPEKKPEYKITTKAAERG
jgi:hypothetical protein